MKSYGMKTYSSGSRNGLIEFYRIVFTFMVVSYHSAPLRDFDSQIMLFAGGYIGTDFFFILSGFLISMAAWSKQDCDSINIARDLVHEIKKRAVNMYYYFIPVYIVLFCVLKSTLLASKDVSSILHEIFISSGELLFLGMAGVSRTAGNLRILHGPLWYFSSLLICLLIIYPLLRKHRELFSTSIAPMIVILCYGYHIVNYEHLGLWGN